MFALPFKLVWSGIETAGGWPAEFASFLQSEMKKWEKVAKDAGV